MIFIALNQLNLQAYIAALTPYQLQGSTDTIKLLGDPFQTGRVGIILEEPGLIIVRSTIRLKKDMLVLRAENNVEGIHEGDIRHNFAYMSHIAESGHSMMENNDVFKQSSGSANLLSYSCNNTATTITYPPHHYSTSIYVQVTTNWLRVHVPELLAFVVSADGDCRPDLIYNAPASTLPKLDNYRKKLDFEMMNQPWRLKKLVVDFLNYTFRIMNAEALHASSDSQAKLIRQMDLLIQQVLANIHKPLPSLAEMSVMADINIHTLRAAFKRQYGQSIADYFVSRQMEWAAKALQQKDASVKLVGYSIGYHNMSHFAASFRKYQGIPPGDVRK